MTTVYTIGHSTRPLEEFVGLLQAYDVTQLVDIRTIPKSRHNPQYEQAALAHGLEQHNIQYVYLKELGGLRSAVKSPQNTAWRNKSFRNYADYMQTDDFAEGVKKLLTLSNNRVTAIMCAEAVPWRCHRSLVGDALVARAVNVRDIMSSTRAGEHTLTSFAVVRGTNVTYPEGTN